MGVLTGEDGLPQSQGGNGMFGLLMSMLLSEKSSVAVAEPDAQSLGPLKALADRLTQQAVESLQGEKGDGVSGWQG